MSKNITLIKPFLPTIFCLVFIGILTQCNKAENAEIKENNSSSDSINSTFSNRPSDTSATSKKGYIDNSVSPNSAPQFELKIIKTDGLGWGYDLYQKGKIYIHQPTIPAISGMKGFGSQAEAKLVGDLVLNKLNKDAQLPTISMNELDSLKIQY